MNDSAHQADTPSPAEDAEALLRRVGWGPLDMIMAEIFVDVPPARKVAVALRLRHELVALLRSRLRREHPDCSDADLAQMVQEELALLKRARERRIT